MTKTTVLSHLFVLAYFLHCNDHGKVLWDMQDIQIWSQFSIWTTKTTAASMHQNKRQRLKHTMLKTVLQTLENRRMGSKGSKNLFCSCSYKTWRQSPIPKQNFHGKTALMYNNEHRKHDLLSHEPERAMSLGQAFQPQTHLKQGQECFWNSQIIMRSQQPHLQFHRRLLDGLGLYVGHHWRRSRRRRWGRCHSNGRRGHHDGSHGRRRRRSGRQCDVRPRHLCWRRRFRRRERWSAISHKTFPEFLTQSSVSWDLSGLLISEQKVWTPFH